jgi:hypothetical protein
MGTSSSFREAGTNGEGIAPADAAELVVLIRTMMMMAAKRRRLSGQDAVNRTEQN